MGVLDFDSGWVTPSRQLGLCFVAWRAILTSSGRRTPPPLAQKDRPFVLAPARYFAVFSLSIRTFWANARSDIDDQGQQGKHNMLNCKTLRFFKHSNKKA